MAPVVDLRAADRETLFDVLIAELELTDNVPLLVEMPYECGCGHLAARHPATSALYWTPPKFNFHFLSLLNLRS